MKFSKLVEHVSKRPIAPYVKQLVAEVMVSDEDGEDVEVRHVIKLHGHCQILFFITGAFCGRSDLEVDYSVRDH